jgi:hypothetical protein
VVQASTTAEAVRSAGGWLFDRVMAGWDVTVLVSDVLDSRPLHILGARAVDLGIALSCHVRKPKPHALAVDAGLYAVDERVRHSVQDALEDGLTDVWLWGDQWPEDLNDEVDPVHHRLSVAARAFKAQALAAAAVPVGGIGTTEVFRAGELLPESLDTSRLVPV